MNMLFKIFLWCVRLNCKFSTIEQSRGKDFAPIVNPEDGSLVDEKQFLNIIFLNLGVIGLNL
jgi:hypothetical protein